MFGGQPGVGSDEHSLLHDAVSNGKLDGDAHGSRVVAAELDEGRLPHEVAAEEHAVANLLLIKVGRQLGAGEGGLLADGNFETEP